MQIGAYKGNGSDGVSALNASFLPWLGRAPDLMVDFLAFDTWANFKSDANWCIPAWKGVVPQLCITVPLTCKGTTLGAVATGNHDLAYQVVAKLLANNFPNAIVRLGHEANGGWYPWGNLTTAKLQTDYKNAFQHVVTLMRSYAPNLKFDWCTAAQWQQIGDKSVIYPGDACVDYIGMDIYAEVWGANFPNASQCGSALMQGWSLDWVFGFAQAHNKLVSFPELGVGDAPQGSLNYGPGDNADVATWLMQKAQQNKVAYVGFWDFNAGDYNSEFTTGERPNCSAAYRTALGI